MSPWYMSIGISKQPAWLLFRRNVSHKNACFFWFSSTSRLDHSAAAPHHVESTPQSTPKVRCSKMIPVSTCKNAEDWRLYINKDACNNIVHRTHQQTNKQTSRQAGRRAGRQAGRHARKQASNKTKRSKTKQQTKQN